ARHRPRARRPRPHAPHRRGARTPAAPRRGRGRRGVAGRVHRARRAREPAARTARGLRPPPRAVAAGWEDGAMPRRPRLPEPGSLAHVRLITVDMDGTLLDDRKRPSPVLPRLLELLARRGVHFTPA